MKIPRRDLEYGNGLRLPARNISTQSWQYHVIKHPLGLWRDPPPPNDDPEGWGKLEPPVTEPGWRNAILKTIRAIEQDGKGCELPEVHRRRPTRDEAQGYACWSCDDRVADRCFGATHGIRPVGRRYADVIHEVLELLTEGLVVHRHDFWQAVAEAARWPDKLRGLSAMRVMKSELGRKSRLARFLREDGLVVDFRVPARGATGTWRTTFRSPREGVPLAQQFSNLSGLASDRLSETCVVARPWWESHGI